MDVVRNLFDFDQKKAEEGTTIDPSSTYVIEPFRW